MRDQVCPVRARRTTGSRTRLAKGSMMDRVPAADQAGEKVLRTLTLGGLRAQGGRGRILARLPLRPAGIAPGCQMPALSSSVALAACRYAARQRSAPGSGRRAASPATTKPGRTCVNRGRHIISGGWQVRPDQGVPSRSANTVGPPRCAKGRSTRPAARARGGIDGLRAVRNETGLKELPIPTFPQGPPGAA